MSEILSDSDVGEAVRAVFGQTEVARIYDTLKRINNEENLRLVGGSVRDLYLGREQHDLDFATTLEPKQVLNALERAHIRVPKVDRAFSHGTVLAVLGKRQFEITTLRHDMQTDGRHAKVQFTDNWEEDAKRRDFTVNALYGGQGGEIFDFHNGRADMQNRRLRFIGNATERIAEDYLRVLRFFRFHAVLGWTEWDADDVAACKAAAEAGELERLSGERLWQEFSRILGIDDDEVRIAVLKKMEESSVLQATLGESLPLSSNWEKQFKLYDEAQSGIPAELKEKMEAQNLTPPPGEEVVTHLALLLSAENAHELAEKRFRLSWKERSHLYFTHSQLSIAEHIDSEAKYKIFCQGLYNDFHNHLSAEINQQAFDNSEGVSPNIEPLSNALLAVRIQRLGVKYEGSSAEWIAAYVNPVKVALEWEHKYFPISGDDLKEMGLTEGKEIGSIKKEVREWWLNKKREPNREECLAKARELARERGLI